MMFLWGTFHSAIPVSWSNWLTRRLRSDPEAGGGLMVGAIQVAIMLGGVFGGVLLDHLSITATFVGGIVLLTMAGMTMLRERRGGSLGDNTRQALAPAEGQPAEA